MFATDNITKIILVVIAVLLADIIRETWAIRDDVRRNHIGYVCTDHLIRCQVEIVGPVQLDQDTIRQLNQ